MADFLVDNGVETDFKASSKTLSGSAPAPQVPAVELVTAVEGGARTDLAKAEDAAHVSGDFGIMALAVRTDTAAARAGTDGDYIPLIVDSSGRLHVNVGVMPAAARTTDSIAAAQQTDVLMDNLTALTPARAAINASSSGNNTLVAAQGSGNAIRVHHMFLMAAGTVTATFETGAGGTDLIGPLPLIANVGFVLPPANVPWIVTGDDALLNLNLSAAVQVSGCLVYTVA